MLKHARNIALLLAAFMVSDTAQAACRDSVADSLPVAPAAEAGVSAATLVHLLEELDQAGHEIRSLLIARDCRLILERYRHDLDRTFNHAVYSVTKSVTATLIGILQYQGKLGNGALDAPVADLVTPPSTMPADSWEKARQISLRNAMQMASGIEYDHDPAGHPICGVHIDRLMVALRPPLAHKPGMHFQYSDGDATLSGAVVAARAGQPLYDAAKTLLFDPLQMRSHNWLYRDIAGRYPGGWALRLRPVDMIKVGQLYLQDCMWNGQRLCDGGYIAQAWAPGVSRTYGLHWWRDQRGNTPYFAARGFKGQLVLVFPAQDAVVAMTAVIPPRDISRVESLLADTVLGMIGMDGDPAAQTKLAALQAAGFRGELRRSTTSQDLRSK